MKSLLIGLFVALFSSVASAQVVQPSYVRPSKGAPLVIAQVTATSTAATYTNSALFDWTAFAGVVVTVNMTGLAPTASACRYGVRVQSLGSSSTTLSDFFLLNVANNDYQASSSQSWYVRVLPGYLRFSIGLYQANASGQPSCSYKVTATPLPFDYAGELVSTGVTSFVRNAESFYEVSFNSSRPYTRIQAVGDDVVYCTPVGDDGTYPPLAADWPIRLNSQTNLRPAFPNVIEINNWVGRFVCAGQIGVFQH